MPEGVTLPLDQAAASLGLSVEAVRMRVRRGTLPSTKRDGRLYVMLPADTATTPATGRDRAETDRQPGGVDPRDALIAQLKTQVDDLRVALERSQQGEAELRRMLNLEQQTLAAVTAPRELPAPASADPPATRVETGENGPAAAETTRHQRDTSATNQR